jgi:hypothetical protein
MATSSAILFSVAIAFYILAWKYIHQMVREVNANAVGSKVSMWRWEKGWRIHKQSFPSSLVRRRLAACMALTAVFGLVAFSIEVHSKFPHR